MSEDWSELLKKDLSKLAEIVVPHAVKFDELREGERREVAILFLDLMGFTTLSEMLDHEEVHQIVNGIMQALARIVGWHGGQVDKFEGDLIMALFGAKLATENDCVRAVSCGVKMLETIAEINSLLSVRNIRVNARVGISYGWVTVAPDPSGHLTVTGDEVNLASRMESNAAVNSVMVTEAVQRECEDHYSWQDLGEIKVKGRTRSVHPFRPIGPGIGLKNRWERANRLARSPLVGREREFTVLESSWKSISTKPTKRRGSWSRHILVDIRADAGIGKSRLVHEFLEKIKKESPQPLILKGQTLSFAQMPLTLWISLLRDHFNIIASDKNACEKLEAGVKKICRSRDRSPAVQALNKSLLFLKSLLSIPVDDPRLETLDAEAKHRETLLALRNLLRVLGEYKSPVVIVLEDLHWIDASSKEALEFILTNCECKMPLLFLCLHRSGKTGEEEPLPRIGTKYVMLKKIELEPIGLEDCRRLIRHMLCTEDAEESASASSPGTGKKVDRRVEDILLKYSQGNPFYLEELVLAMVESGGIIEVRRVWRLAGDPERLGIPSSLSSLIQSRIDRLEPIQRQGLQRSSVIGVEVMQSIYHWVARKLDLVEDDELTMTELEIRDFLRRFALDPEVTYLFKHVVTHKVAYETLLHHNRRILHRLTAEALEELFGESVDQFSSILSHHYHIAAVPQKAIKWGMKALNNCSQNYDNQEALLWANRLTEWLNEEPENEERDRQLLEIWRTELRVLAVLGHTDSRRQTLDRMMKQCEKLSLDAERGEVLGEYGIFFQSTGQTDEAEDYYKRALKVLIKTGDRFREAIVLSNFAGMLYQLMARFDEAQDNYKTALRIFQDIGNRNLEGSVLLNLGIIKLRLSMFDEAEEMIANGLTLYRDLGNSLMEGSALDILGDVYQQQGRVVDARKRLQQALEIHREVGNRRREGHALSSLGGLNEEIGNFDEALSYYQRAEDIYEEIDDVNSQGKICFWLGNLHADFCQLDQAAERYLTSLVLLRKVKDKRGEGMVLTNLAMLLISQGRLDEARNHLETALDIHRTTRYRHFECITLGELGRLHHLLGYLDTAKQYIHQALDIHTEINNLASQGEIQGYMGNLLMDQEHFDEAFSRLSNALEISQKLKDRHSESIALYNIGYWHLRSDHIEEAINHFKLSLEIQAGSHNIELVGFCSCGLSSAYLERDEMMKAKEALDKLDVSLHDNRYTILSTLLHSIRGRYIIRSYTKSSSSEKEPSEINRRLSLSMSHYHKALTLIDQLHLGENITPTRDFSVLRRELIDRGIQESDLTLPHHWQRGGEPD